MPKRFAAIYGTPHEGRGGYKKLNFERVTWRHLELEMQDTSDFEDQMGWVQLLFFVPFYEPPPNDSKYYPDRKGPPALHLEYTSWKDNLIKWGPIKRGMSLMFKRVLEKWLNLNLVRAEPRLPRKFIVSAFPRTRNREAHRIRMLIDCQSLTEDDGYGTAGDRHFIIARMIRSLYLVGLKVHAKPLYRYFQYDPSWKNIDDRTHTLWKISMYGNKWKSYYPDNEEARANPPNDSDNDADSSDGDDQDGNKWQPW